VVVDRLIRMNKLQVASTVMVLALLAGCGRGSTSETAAPTTAPVANVPVTATVDWGARTVEVAGLDDYQIRFCEGEAPILCVSQGGEWIGGIELGSYADGATMLAAGVEAWVEEFMEWLVDDRRRGCDPGYDVAGDDIAPAPFAGSTGWRYGLTGSIDGRVVERVVRHIVLVDGVLHSLGLNGLADDGCLAREGELPLEAVTDLEPALAALAAGSTNLPDAPPISDGSPPGGDDPNSTRRRLAAGPQQ
jgi:hypothetical protein